MARSALINVMVTVAMKAGRALLRDFGETEALQVSRKGPADFVSNADRKAEEIVYKELERARPGYSFLMEESGTRKGTDAQHRWIVDPLDGTTNFLHAIPHFAVSIALERQGRLHAAVVYNPITDELYSAERGAGAFLNDRRIRVSGRTAFNEALIGTGAPFLGHGDVERFVKEVVPVISRSSGIRRNGAASLDLAYVAAGRLDGFWERDLSAWDIAAGILLVREAGGFVTDIDGGEDMLQSGSVIVGNDAIHRQLMEIVRK